MTTEFVLGGINHRNGDDEYDGVMVQAFAEGNQGWHLGKTGSGFMNRHSVGLEICNMGYLEKVDDGGYSLTDDDRYSLYEVHADLLIDGVDDENDIAKPYVVTIDRGSNEVLAIRRNWNPDDSLMLKRQHFVHYVYVPGFGFYGLGLIHIIGGYAMAGTSLIRQLVDAGTLANLPGGLRVGS